MEKLFSGNNLIKKYSRKIDDDNTDDDHDKSIYDMLAHFMSLAFFYTP